MMKNNSVRFESNAEGIREMVIYIAQLVKEGIVYNVTRLSLNEFEVATTGGF